MDSRRAKEILAQYRPDEIATDPEVGEALEQARRDPQLAAWFAEHRAALDTPAATTSTPPVSKRWFKSPAFVLFVIAAFVFAAGFIVSINTPKPKDAFTSYRDRMARLVQRAYPVKITTTDQTQAREYFRTNSGMTGILLPRNLEKLPAKGAAVFPWHSRLVSLLSLDAGGGTNLYLFLIKRSAFPDATVPKTARYDRVGSLTTASWTTNDEVCVLTGPGDQAWLRSYLE